MESATFASLNAIVSQSHEADVEQTVVLLHGYGAPGTDLVGLAPQLRTEKSTRFVFLQAPHTLPGMSGPHAGRAWWHIDMMELQVMRMTEQYELLAQSHPEGLDEARALVDAALEEVVSSGSPWEKTFVGGFSQGAMLTCDWALRSDKAIAGLIQLSGTTLCQDVWQERLAKRSALRVFQSHSPDDMVLPMALAERLRDMMRRAGLNHHWTTFAGGHGIGGSVCDELRTFLSK